MKTFDVIYEYGGSPIKKVNKLIVGELYATSSGDIVLYNGGNGEEFVTVVESPLTPMQGNTLERLS